jgi:hypothetical protein
MPVCHITHLNRCGNHHDDGEEEEKSNKAKRRSATSTRSATRRGKRGRQFGYFSACNLEELETYRSIPFLSFTNLTK